MKKLIIFLLLVLPLSAMAQNAQLNFENRNDFRDAQRGFIATWSEPEIKNEDGSVAYQLASWDFLKEECPATANPSLWRQSQLNRIHGLFEVIPNKVYQVRGFDLANMTFIKSETGWIIIDVLTSKAPAAAGYALVKEHLGDLPVRAIIITHPHIDHYGGIDGILENTPNQDFEIIAPKGFLKHAQEENIMAGVAMSRRASYMYGSLLPMNGCGNLGTGLGQTNSFGIIGTPVPSIEIAETGEKMSIDGVDMEFVYAPSAEAPVEIMIYFPQLKAYCTAEEMTHNIHNLLTLRGAVVRNGLLWSKHIDKSLQLYGDEVEVSFSSHHWPTWGNEEIVRYWTAQRDLYRFMHDQTLNLANKGYTPIEIAEQVVLPESLDTMFCCRGYYGTVNHNVKAQYQLYFGWYDGNPANLNPLPPVEQGQRYVTAMGGAKKVMKIAKKAYLSEDYRWCATLLNNLVFAEPEFRPARELLAETYLKLGYQAESGPWRNFYLTGAQELTKEEKPEFPITIDVKSISELSGEMLFDFLAIQINGKLADGKSALVNIHFTDSEEDVCMMLGNSTLNHRLGEVSPKADLSISLTKSDFIKMMLGMEKPADLTTAGKMTAQGDMNAMTAVLSSMDAPDPGFEIVLP